MLYSNSLSFGIKEAVDNNIDIEDLIIIAGSNFSSKEEMIEHYSKFYWTESKYTVYASQIWELGRIIQPRQILEEEFSLEPYGNAPAAYCWLSDLKFIGTEADFKASCSHNEKLFNALRERNYI